MQELICKFRPDDGSSARTITLRIYDPVRSAIPEKDWSADFEILGFDEAERRSSIGVDWCQALEWAPKLLALSLQGKVMDAGGGTLDPPFYTLDPEPPAGSPLAPATGAEPPDGSP